MQPKERGGHPVSTPTVSHYLYTSPFRARDTLSHMPSLPFTAHPVPVFCHGASILAQAFSSKWTLHSQEFLPPPVNTVSVRLLNLLSWPATCSEPGHPPLRAGLCSRLSFNPVIRQEHSTWLPTVPNFQSPEQGQAHSRCSLNTCSLDSKIRDS